MEENLELVQRGFRLLVRSMSGYIAKEMRRSCGNSWWDEILKLLDDQTDLPYGGDFGELVDSLDIANCIRIIDRGWNDFFRDKLSMNCRTWSKELMGVRNIAAHRGNNDLEQPIAERALNTMLFLCRELDADGAEEIEPIYLDIRSRAADGCVPYRGLAQPESDSKRGSLESGSLLKLVDTDVVRRTEMTRKVTYGGQTKVYPVYQVRLDALFYNEQNDRISTWITSYESEYGQDSLSDLPTEIYNRIIENFVFESNPDALMKTQKNIGLVGQREPGVTLADGRVVDGNRRFTCLRRMQRETNEPLYFETVLMDMDIQADKKKIKLLELAIQHGEEKKVDYDQIDYAIGTYRDIVKTKLLTSEEYAESTGESAAEIRKRLAVADLIVEFLDHIRLPDQYHIAREYQVYSVMVEMMTPLGRLSAPEKKQLKTIVFNNIMMKAVPDQRKFIRNIKSLVTKNSYGPYFLRQMEIDTEIQQAFADEAPHKKEDLDAFAEGHRDLTDALLLSMEEALQRYRSQQLHDKPSENVRKCISLLMDIDSRLFSKLDPDDAEQLKTELDRLSAVAESFRQLL